MFEIISRQYICELESAAFAAMARLKKFLDDSDLKSLRLRLDTTCDST